MMSNMCMGDEVFGGPDNQDMECLKIKCYMGALIELLFLVDIQSNHTHTK